MKNKRRMFNKCKKSFFLLLVLILIVITNGIVGDCFSSVSNASNLEQKQKYYTCYTIQSGDTLWSIAQAHKTSEYDTTDSYLKEVCTINKIGNSQSIIAGHTLILPYYNHVVR